MIIFCLKIFIILFKIQFYFIFNNYIKDKKNLKVNQINLFIKIH